MYKLYSLNHQENLLEQQAYNNVYFYDKNHKVNLKMLSSIILNNNIILFRKILKNQRLYLKEKKYLLLLVAKEGDKYLSFALELLKYIKLKDKEIIQLIIKSTNSNSIKLLKLFFNLNNSLDISIDLISAEFNKNPNLLLLKYLCKKFGYKILSNNKILSVVIEGDYIDLFKYLIIHKKHDLNTLLSNSIKMNAYEIIDYLFNKIKLYKVINNKNYYNNFFDYLITERIEKIKYILNKCQNIFNFGRENLERLLSEFQHTEHMELFLFNYKLSNLEVKDKALKNSINNCLLRDRLSYKLLAKKQKEKIKKL